MATVEGNVVLAVSHLAPRLGEVVDGLVYEGTNCACSAGVIMAGTANNVVPRHAVLRGTLRTFTASQKDRGARASARTTRRGRDTFTCARTRTRRGSTPAVDNNADVTSRSCQRHVVLAPRRA
jgi:metal-dependent amidase/aminoacylase/carboxypeptidase family protein